MGRNVDLWAYLPPFLRDFREMCEILAAEQPEFQDLVTECDNIIDNMFIQTANETGIARFENVINIHPGAGDTLDTRRSAIMTRWNDVTPYTKKALKSRIASIQGNDDVDIEINFSNVDYQISIVTRLERQGQVNDLAYILKTVLPCNLIIRSVNMIMCESETSFIYSVGQTITGTMFLTNDINETLNIRGGGFLGIGETVTHIIQTN